MGLRDLLDKQKAEREKKNEQKPAPKEHVSGPAIKPENKPAEGTAIQAGQEIAGNVTGNRPISGQEIPPVPPPGLSGLALLKWKKANAYKSPDIAGSGTQIENAPSVSQEKSGTTGTAIINRTIAPQNNKLDLGAKDAEKKNDGSIEVERLRNNLTYLANNIEQKELVAQVVRTIAVQLKNNPEITPFMSNGDVDLVVRGLRAAYKTAARKKTEIKEKKTEKTRGMDELEAAFKDVGLDLKL